MILIYVRLVSLRGFAKAQMHVGNVIIYIKIGAASRWGSRLLGVASRWGYLAGTGAASWYGQLAGRGS